MQAILLINLIEIAVSLRTEAARTLNTPIDVLQNVLGVCLPEILFVEVLCSYRALNTVR